MEIEVPILCNKNNGLDISMELGSTAIYNVQLHVLRTYVPWLGSSIWLSLKGAFKECTCVSDG